MFTNTDTPLRLVLRFPPSWSASARAMAAARQMTQAEVDSIEAECARFRALRDALRAAHAADAAAYERHWQANGKRLSDIPVPPVPHIFLQEQAA